MSWPGLGRGIVAPIWILWTVTTLHVFTTTSENLVSPFFRQYTWLALCTLTLLFWKTIHVFGLVILDYETTYTTLVCIFKNLIFRITFRTHLYVFGQEKLQISNRIITELYASLVVVSLKFLTLFFDLSLYIYSNVLLKQFFFFLPHLHTLLLGSLENL